MKIILILLFRLYWLVPGSLKGRCVFKESCSRYVYKALVENGVFAAIRAFLKRLKTCNGGMLIVEVEEKEMVMLCNREFVELNTLADWVYEETIK